jgi:hypothetical protein
VAHDRGDDVRSVTLLEEALLNLREALELYFSSPAAGAVPVLRHVEVEIGAA